jgi:hypothetical protein
MAEPIPTTSDVGCDRSSHSRRCAVYLAELAEMGGDPTAACEGAS